MNIAFFTNAYKPIISGVVHSIELFKKGLNYYGHNVYIFAPAFPEYNDNEENIYRFKSINLTGKMKFPLPIPFSNRIFRVFPKLNIDVIHTQHPFLLGEVGANLAKKYNIPLMFTFHTQYEQYTHYIPFNQNLMKMIAKASVINYIKKCDLVISPAESIKKSLLEYGIKRPIEVVHNAVEVEKFQNLENLRAKKIREKLNIKDGEKVLMYVGRMALEKNLAFMLQSHKIILKSCPEAKLVIIGEGPELEELKALSKDLGLSGKVLFTGRIEYEEIPAYFAAADLFVVTSTTEVKPLAVLEALSSGLPVAGVAVPWLQDIIKDKIEGVLAPLDVNEYANCVIDLLKDENFLKKLSKNALSLSKNYSLLNTAKKLIDIYIEQIELKQRVKLEN